MNLSILLPSGIMMLIALVSLDMMQSASTDRELKEVINTWSSALHSYRNDNCESGLASTIDESLLIDEGYLTSRTHRLLLFSATFNSNGGTLLSSVTSRNGRQSYELRRIYRLTNNSQPIYDSGVLSSVNFSTNEYSQGSHPVGSLLYSSYDNKSLACNSTI